MSLEFDHVLNQLKVDDSSVTNAPIVIQPQGTGALQAQATTSSTVGGNARGSYAVDWQMTRGAASQVANALNSTIGGGALNTSSSSYAIVAGGYSNTANGFASFIGGGQQNSVTGLSSAVVSGWSNTAAGNYNFIGTGWQNSGTSASAVTTQSATMNGTTAVTLAASNANIKVGQYISGTSIGNNTYVAAISGTSLTLSQAASGSSTSTLSFFTPHGVVVGGGNNQATGSYSFIGGGGDAGNTANRNIASGDWSFIGGGAKNVASGAGSFVGGGGTQGAVFGGNNATGNSSVVTGGYGNTASGVYATIIGGQANSANAQSSTVLGGTLGTTRSITGNTIFPSCSQPISGVLGVSQAGLLILGRETTDATATILASNASAISGSNQVILPNNSAYYVMGTIIAGVTGGGNTSSWEFKGAIKRGANAASTTLVAAITPTVIAQNAGASGWVVSVTADTTNGGLAVTVTGQAATTIRWVCKIETTEMTF